MINKTSLSFILGFVGIIGLSLVVIMGASIFETADNEAQTVEVRE